MQLRLIDQISHSFGTKKEYSHRLTHVKQVLHWTVFKCVFQVEIQLVFYKKTRNSIKKYILREKKELIVSTEKNHDVLVI